MNIKKDFFWEYVILCALQHVITFLHLGEILRMEFLTGIPPCFSKGKTELENWNELFLGQIMYANYWYTEFCFLTVS